MKTSCNFELACLKKKKKNILAVWQLSGSVLSQWVLLVMKTQHLKMNGMCIKAY